MRNWVFNCCAVFCLFNLNRWMLWECKLGERISHNQLLQQVNTAESEYKHLQKYTPLQNEFQMPAALGNG